VETEDEALVVSGFSPTFAVRLKADTTHGKTAYRLIVFTDFTLSTPWPIRYCPQNGISTMLVRSFAMTLPLSRRLPAAA